MTQTDISKRERRNSKGVRFLPARLFTHATKGGFFL